jgi:hypothetical protein
MTEPTFFLNAYAISANISLGTGNSNSACQLKLIEDPDNGYNIQLPEVGTACIFTAGDLSFGGVLQRKNYEESTSGLLWDVTLETPAKVLDGVSIILDTFQGDGYIAGNSTSLGTKNDTFTNQIKNVWNPFAVRENYDYGGIFGGSNINSFGYPAADLLTLLEEISREEHEFGGKISYGETEYTLDLTELKNVMPDNYRVKGPVTSLATIIADVAEASSVDYVVTIEGTTNSYGVITSDAKIKIKTIDKSEAPRLGVVDQKISDLKEEQRWISSASGQELSDSATQKIIVGGPATRYWRAKLSEGNIFPVWGKLDNTGVEARFLLSSPILSTSQFDSTQVPVILDSGRVYYATILEIWAAMAGREAWNAYNVMKGKPGIYARSKFNQELIQLIESGEATPLDLYDTVVRDATYLSLQNEDRDTQRIFDAIANVGNEYWGKQFLVKLPVEPGGISNNLKYVEEDKDYITSWEISSSAWVEDSPIDDISFYDSEGKLKTTATFLAADPELYDYSSFGVNYQLAFGGVATFNGVSVDNDIYWTRDPSGNVTAFALVTVPQVAYYGNETRADDGIFQLAKLVFGLDPDSEGAIFCKRSGYEGLKFTLPPVPTMPIEIGIPQSSTRYSYGPWYGATQLNGKAEIVSDTNLRPEVFGSTQLMNEAAESLAYVANTNVGAVENGVVQTIGLPEFDITDRFTSDGPYITGMSIDFSTSQITTQYTFNTYTKQGGKLEKYNYDRIANINKNTIRSLQELRELYTLPEFRQPFPKPPINRSVQADNILANGFTVFMQNFNPFTGKRSGAGLNSVQAAMIANSDSYSRSNTQKEQPIVDNSDNSESEEELTTSKPKSRDDVGLYGGGDHLAPTSKELSPNFSTAVSIDHSKNPEIKISDADQGLQGKDLNTRNRRPSKRVNTLADACPTLMSGWGFDVNGLPVPRGGQAGQFADDAGNDIKKNKRGPAEWRWHDKRGVWTGGNTILEGILTASIGAAASPLDPNTNGRMKVFRGEGWEFDSEDATGTAEEIVITNRDTSLSVDIDDANTDIYCMCIEINYEWRPVYVGCV